MAASYCALVIFAATMQRTSIPVLGRRLAPPLAFRWQCLAWALLGLSLCLVSALPDGPIAVVTWIGMVSATALIVALMVSYRPAWLRWSAFVIAGATIGLVLLGR